MMIMANLRKMETTMLGSSYNCPGEEMVCSKASGGKSNKKWLDSGYVFKVDLTGLADEVNIETKGKEVKVTDRFLLEDISRLG